VNLSRFEIEIDSIEGHSDLEPLTNALRAKQREGPCAFWPSIFQALLHTGQIAENRLQIKPLQFHEASVPVLTFVSLCSTLSYRRRPLSSLPKPRSSEGCQ
jgi:hypothetical protein